MFVPVKAEGLDGVRPGRWSVEAENVARLTYLLILSKVCTNQGGFQWKSANVNDAVGSGYPGATIPSCVRRASPGSGKRKRRREGGGGNVDGFEHAKDAV